MVPAVEVSRVKDVNREQTNWYFMGLIFERFRVGGVLLVARTSAGGMATKKPPLPRIGE
jgi:hypothetical protein